ncbi:MAG: type I-E CRISPR-associated protein Cse2/CasB [Bryobacterales bacterium]|nr:type I-E CRISPR-associated protein Cse2/CasB [Bryobacterales bacterium]
MAKPAPLTLQFIDYLEGLARREDRGALAALRRGLSAPPGCTPETYPYVVPWLPNERSSVAEAAYFLVGGLFAFHPENREPAERKTDKVGSAMPPGRGSEKYAAEKRDNFGASFAALLEKSGSIEKRFVALLASRWEDLPEHLRHAVALLKAEAVSIDYAQLLEDLQRWNAANRSIQRAWARSFWRGSIPPQPGDQADSKLTSN